MAFQSFVLLWKIGADAYLPLVPAAPPRPNQPKTFQPNTTMLIWIILILVPMLFGLYAQMKIRSAYARNVEIPSRGQIRGSEAAEIGRAHV